MARQQKQTVDYFPHYADASLRKTITILQDKYGDTGYAVWFRLLEALASSDGHYISCSLQLDWEYLTRRLFATNEQVTEILKTLVELNAIDRELWEQKKIIWSDNFLANVAEVYRNRRRDLPQKPSGNGNLPVIYTQSTEKVHPQSRVEKSRVDNNIKGEETKVSTLPEELNKLKSKNGEKVAQVFVGLDKLRNGYRPPKRKAEAASIIRMLNKGFAPEQILDTWSIMKQDKFWADKELFMMSVESQIGAKLNGASKYTSGKYGSKVEH